MSLRNAFESYIVNTSQVECDIRSSTNAAYTGGCYVLELFPDGAYRTLWSGHVGNLYHSPGLLINIPTLAEDEDASDDPDGDDYYDNAIEELRCKADEALETIGQ